MRRILPLMMMLCVLVLPCCVQAAEEYKSVFSTDIFLMTSRYYRYITALEADDYSLACGNINYRRNEVLRMGESMRFVADGGMESVNGTFSIGCGAGISAPDLWYYTFTYTVGKTSEETMMVNTYAMALSALDMVDYVNRYAGSDRHGDGAEEQDPSERMAEAIEIAFQLELSEENMEYARVIADALLTSEQSIGFEMDGVLIFMRPIGSGRILVGVSSKSFFDDFYRGTLADYIVID